MKMRGQYFSKTISLDGIKPKTNLNPNTNPNPKLTLILTLFSCFMLFFEHRHLIFSLAQQGHHVICCCKCLLLLALTFIHKFKVVIWETFTTWQLHTFTPHRTLALLTKTFNPDPMVEPAARVPYWNGDKST